MIISSGFYFVLVVSSFLLAGFWTRLVAPLDYAKMTYECFWFIIRNILRASISVQSERADTFLSRSSTSS